MENMNEDYFSSEKVQSEIENKITTLKQNDPKLKRIYPIMVLGDVEAGEKAGIQGVLYTGGSLLACVRENID